MSEMKFEGIVKGYNEYDDGMIMLAIEELNTSMEAQVAVGGLQRDFNPTNTQRHGYGCDKVVCKVKPGFANYTFRVEPEKARNIQQGNRVEVVIDVYNYRRPYFNRKSWLGMSEMHYILKAIRQLEPASGGAAKAGAK